MAKRIRFMTFIVFALGWGAGGWSAPAQSSAVESSDSGCSDPIPAVLIADIRVNGGV